MIRDSDRLVLAPGVAYANSRLTDAVRGEGWPLNESGVHVIERIARPVGDIVRETGRAWAVPAETARDDVFRFAWRLNALGLVNVERDVSIVRRVVDWIVLALRLAPAGALPGAIARRRSIDTRSCSRAVGSTLAATLPRAAALAAAATAIAGHLLLIAGAPGVLGALALGLGVGVGVGLHEAGHAAALRGVPAALLTRGPRIHVMHARIGSRRRWVVALAGPLAVSLLGLGLVVGGVLTAAPAVAVGGCPLVAHAFGLTVACGDGRVACGL